MTETVATPEPHVAKKSGKPGLTLSALIVSIVAVAVGAAGLTFGLIEHSDVIRQARSITHLENRQATLTHEMTTIISKVAGTSRDVITCVDLQNMYLQDYYLDSNFNLQSNPISLPQHCINH